MKHVARIIDREFRGDPAWASILIHHLIQAGDHEAAAHRVLEFAGNAAQTDRYGIASRLLEKVVGFIETPYRSMIKSRFWIYWVIAI